VTLLIASSRQQLLQHIRTVAYQDAPRWGTENSATIVIMSPVLGRAEIEAAFREIDEICHLDGIDLRVHQQEGEYLRAVLEPSWSSTRGREATS
jgi:hypothetical protein